MMIMDWWWITGLVILVLASLLALLVFSKRPEGDKTKQVSLGCGTLILIALVVLIASSAAVDDLESEVTRLRTSVDELKKSVDSQTNVIHELQTKIEKAPATPETQRPEQD